MSMITACPACHTEFEVTEPQLQAYAGKVRCGECAHVFDARAYLLADAATQRFESEADAPAPLNDLTTPPADSPSWASQFSFTAPKSRLEPTLDLNESAPIPAFLQSVPLSDPSAASATTPLQRTAYTAGLLVLLMGLLLQALYMQRVSLAAEYPASRPWLQRLCHSLKCNLPLPQDISQLTIDDADIQEHKERQGVLVFGSILMNHSTVAQAYPRIELTLTNLADEAVMRRIFTPEQYLPAQQSATQGLGPQQEVPIKLLLGVDDKQVTGFRVAIAY